ncbi:MAG: hypothetical protein JXA74_15485 [Anaerolineae bacterium]|nr:hypothetical protein [Anaerolineae bacterium]
MQKPTMVRAALWVSLAILFVLLGAGSARAYQQDTAQDTALWVDVDDCGEALDAIEAGATTCPAPRAAEPTPQEPVPEVSESWLERLWSLVRPTQLESSGTP